MRFIAFGDSGTGSAEQQQISYRSSARTASTSRCTAATSPDATRTALARAPTSLIRTGFQRLPAVARVHPFFPLRGNHDSRPSNNNGPAYLDCFRCRETARPPRIRTTPSGTTALITARSISRARYRVRVPGHYPPFRTDRMAGCRPGVHRARGKSRSFTGLRIRPGSTARTSRCDRPSGRCSSATGAVVISAHEHTTRRTWPMQGGPAVLRDYIVTGGGGATLYRRPTVRGRRTPRHGTITACVGRRCTLQVSAIGLNGAPFDGTKLRRCSSPPSCTDFPRRAQLSRRPATLNLAAAASDNRRYVRRVDFYAGGMLARERHSAPYGVVWNDVPAGTYSLRGVAVDNRGVHRIRDCYR